jgi:hypothetical protein
MFIEQRFILPLMIVKYEHALPRNSTVHSFAEVTFVYYFLLNLAIDMYARIEKL